MTRSIFTILASGQSNMVGAGRGGDREPMPRIKAWNGSAWVMAEMNVPPFRVEGPNRNNLAFHFAKRYAADHPDTEVRIVIVAHGGLPIIYWTGNSVLSPHYREIREALAASGTDRVDVILWHQGEADKERTHEAYARDFQALLTNLRAEPCIAETTPVIAGELGGTTFRSHQNGFYRDIQRFLGDPHVAVAAADDLPLVGAEQVHFTGSALAILGGRYYEAYRRLTGATDEA